MNLSDALPQGPLSFESLPDDVLRRVVDTVEPSPPPQSAIAAGAPPPSPLKTAHILAAVSRRLRAYVVLHYLPSITSLGPQDWELLRANNSVYGAASAVVALLGRCSGLKVFSSENARQGLITSEAVRTMAETAGETLETVDIKFIDLNNEAIRPLFACPRLRRLEMSFGRLVTPNLFHFGEGQTIVAPLEFLDLTWLSCVDKNAVEHIARVGTLTALIMKNCENFNDECARILAAGPAAKSIVDLSLSYCPISNESLCFLIAAMPQLQKVMVAERAGPYHIPTAYNQAGIDAAKERFREINLILDT